MKKFDMSSAWDDAMQLARSDTALTAPVVGLLVVLPTLAYFTLGPVPIEPPADVDLETLGAIIRADFMQSAPMLLLVSFLSSLASLAVMRLWLAPRGTSVGEALAMALGLVPVVLAIFLLQLFAIGLAALALVVPALYVGGRLTPSFAVLAAGDTRNPLGALAQSWEMTRGNGWRIALMLLLIQIVFIIISMLVDGVGAAFGDRGTIGHAIASLMSATLGGMVALVGSAVNAAIYRQLSPSTMARTFD